MIKIQFQVGALWIDSRLFYTNLNSNFKHNTLSEEEMEKIWKPILIFNNAEFKDEVRFLDENSVGYVKVNPGANFEYASLSYLQNFKWFYGIEGFVLILQKYNKVLQLVLFFCRTLLVKKRLTLKFTCSFRLELYPFDTQECLIEIINNAIGGGRHINLLPGNAEFLGFEYVKEYRIKSLRFVKTASTMVTMTITLERQLLYLFLTNLLPVVLINLVKLFLYRFSTLLHKTLSF